MGGTQSLHTNSYDETYALPTEEAATLALRTQQVIAEESGVSAVADPLAGSYFIETLTDQMEKEAMVYIDKIDQMGGIVKAVEEGYPQKEIARSAYEFQRQVDSKSRSIVGVNKYVTDDDDKIPTLKIAHEVERSQIERIKALKAKRDQEKAKAGLKAIRDACKDESINLMPPIIQAVKDHVTLGEICDIFREEFGIHTDPAYL